MCKCPFVFNLETGRFDCLAQLRWCIQADMICPDAGKYAALNMSIEEGFQGFVDGVPPEGIVGMRDCNRDDAAGFEYAERFAEAADVIVDVFKDFGQNDSIKAAVRIRYVINVSLLKRDLIQMGDVALCLLNHIPVQVYAD